MSVPVEGLDVKGWAIVGLGCASMAAQLFFAIDRWVHGRATKESKLAADLLDLRRDVEDGRTIWDRARDLGHDVATIRETAKTLKEVVDRAIERSAREDRYQERRMAALEIGQAQVNEHLKNTDAIVEELKRLIHLRGDR